MKKTVSSILSVILCLIMVLGIIPLGTVCYAADLTEKEDNNSYANATPVGANQTVNANLSTSSDVDFFKFTSKTQSPFAPATPSSAGQQAAPRFQLLIPRAVPTRQMPPLFFTLSGSATPKTIPTPKAIPTPKTSQMIISTLLSTLMRMPMPIPERL